MHKLVAVFVRHGSTELNDANKFRGPLDVDLDEHGRKQAEEDKEILRTRPFIAAYTSSKKRTKESAAIVLQGRDIKPVELKNLDALNVGEFAGQPKTESNMESIRYYQSNTDAKIPGGERLDDFRKRVDPELWTIIKRGEEAGVPTVAFVHSSIIHEIGKVLHDDHNYIKVRPGGIVGIYKTPTGYQADVIFGKVETKGEGMVS